LRADGGCRESLNDRRDGCDQDVTTKSKNYFRNYDTVSQRQTRTDFFYGTDKIRNGWDAGEEYTKQLLSTFKPLSDAVL